MPRWPAHRGTTNDQDLVYFLWQGPPSPVRNKCNWEYNQNLSLTFENTAGLTSKAIDTTQKSLDALAKVALGDRLALDYHLSEQAVTNTTWRICINTSGEAETQFLKIAEQATWLSLATLSVRSFFDLLDLGWFVPWGPQLQRRFQRWELSCLW